MRGWEQRRRGVSGAKRKNAGCAFCGAPPSRSMWILGAGRVAVCDACRDKKMKEASALADTKGVTP